MELNQEIDDKIKQMNTVCVKMDQQTQNNLPPGQSNFESQKDLNADLMM